ncbi:MAG: hypothetical protein JXA96_13340 [Sedimentisphaerales bacterium]|nr:hypothetical protein [Sedimentisphaerales bacterium]
MKKEIRDALPWIIVSILSLYLFSWFLVRMRLYDIKQGGYGISQSGEMINQYSIFSVDILSGPAVLMFFITILLGLALGFIHFWMPGFRRTWQFMIHRSTTRFSILTSKLSVAAIMVICMSLAWLLLVMFVIKSKSFVIPPEDGMIRLGVFYAFLGFIIYMSTALCALTRARWYTTKLFSILFVFVIYLIIISQANLYRAFFISILAFIILIVQLYQVFLQREF